MASERVGVGSFSFKAAWTVVLILMPVWVYLCVAAPHVAETELWMGRVAVVGACCFCIIIGNLIYEMWR